MAYTEHIVEIMETVNMPERYFNNNCFSRILTFSSWRGWMNANGYKHAMLYLDANIKDACYKVGFKYLLRAIARILFCAVRSTLVPQSGLPV